MRRDGHRDPLAEADDLLMSLPDHPDDSVAAEDGTDSPRDVPLPRAAYRTDGHTGLAALLAREEPEQPTHRPRGDYDDLPLGDEIGRFTGRLVGDQGAFGLGRWDDSADDCDDDGGYSAEEAAVHTVEY